MTKTQSLLPPSLRSIATASLLMAFTATGNAQEGYPLDGTWRARLGSDRTIVVVMKWDGETIDGMINPGPRSMAFSAAALDASNWGVRIEASTPDGGTIVVAGTLVDIGAYNRRIVGTWTENGVASDLELRRE